MLLNPAKVDIFTSPEMSNIDISMRNKTEYKLVPLHTRVSVANEMVKTYEEITSLNSKFNILQRSFTDKMRETRDELQRIILLREITNDRKNSSIAAARIKREIQHISFIFDGLSKIIDRKAEISNGSCVESWIELRNRYRTQIAEIYELQLREAGICQPSPAVTITEDAQMLTRCATVSIADSNISTNDSITMHNSVLVPDTIVSIFDENDQNSTDDIKQKIEKDMHCIGNGVNTLKVIAMELGMELDNHNRTISNSKKQAYETEDVINSKNKNLQDISYGLLANGEILFSRTFQIIISGIAVSIIFFMYRFNA